ncbi:hypothetical protein EUX98_g7582 [Antrodiella citrinella]|uniref:Uncharacterized protein n=1 Tax=Antrodiella citrinella TaxID=2447956 RepID=A0A4S4MTE0_9APHY|nr:hypothetical protein EUX98_g7582 [Antrodiella citrinella]
MPKPPLPEVLEGESDNTKTIRFSDGAQLKTWIGDGAGTHYVTCDLCGLDIGLTVHAHPLFLVRHRGTKVCKARQKKNQLEEERTRAEELTRTLFPPPPATQPPSMSAAGSSTGPREEGGPSHAATSLSRPVTPSPPSRPVTPPSPLPPSDPAPSTPPLVLSHSPRLRRSNVTARTIFESLPEDGEANDDWYSASDSGASSDSNGDSSPTPRPPKCQGILVRWSAGSVWADYPYLQHEERTWPWVPIGWENENWLRLRATACKNWAEGDEDNCVSCRAVPSSRQYMNFLSRAKDGVRSHTPWAYLTGNQMKAMLGKLTTDFRQLSVKKIPRLIACRGNPTKAEVLANIAAFYDPENTRSSSESSPIQSTSGTSAQPTATQKLPGHIVMVDDVTINEKCRQHSHNVVTQVTDLASVERIAKALEDEKCCFGKDATIAAVAPYGRRVHYSPTPVLASPTCKHDTGENIAEWQAIVLEAWSESPYGEALHGPIWSLGTDGEASFRLAQCILCLAHPVDPDSVLGRALQKLDGVNTMTSRTGVVATCDPKHVIKHFATLARNPQGIAIGTTVVTCDDIYENLQTITGVTPETAMQLLDPADKQNVPKAVNLVQHMLMLEAQPLPLLPGKEHRRKQLSLFAKIVGSFTLPFIITDMSLSQQIRSLAKYAYAAAAMWIKHGTGFMTGALYADSQAIVKNIIFCILRLQEIDPELELFIMHEGTDRLEGLFSDCRTQDHNVNFDILQLTEKLSTAAIIDRIMERNPDLDRGHRRLDLKGAMGVDRVNPHSWRGDVHVGRVELAAELSAARDEANELLVSYLGADARCDFVALFAKPNHDLLRPEGEYVGVHLTEDDRRTEDPEPTIPDIEKPLEGDSDKTDEADDDLHDDLPEGMDIDDFLPDTMDAMDRGEDSDNMKQVIMVEGKKYLKASVVSSLLSSKRARKVTMRPLRVRGVTLEELHSGRNNLNSVDIAGDDHIKSGDTASTLVRVEEQLCLAIVEVVAFVKGATGASKSRLSSMSVDELEKAGSKVEPTSESVVANLKLVPAVKTCSLPYKGPQGDMQLIVNDLPAHLMVKKLTKDARVSCYLCGREETLAAMRNHVGIHILRAMRHAKEKLIMEVGAEPCGFCGRDGSCVTYFTQNGSKTSIESSCRYHHDNMSYSAAEKSTKNSPSTNVPILCPLCASADPPVGPHTSWKYNMPFHILKEHGVDQVTPELVVRMFISREEEERIGIEEEETKKFRDEFKIPGSDDVKEIRKRERAASMLSAGRRRKYVKK